MSGTADRKDPVPLFTFKVSIQGIECAFFRSVSGLKVETEVQEHFEGGFNYGVRKLIGRTKWPNLVLKQGFVGPPFELWNLHRKTMRGKAVRDTDTRVTGSIIQLGANMSEVCRWTFYNGIVVKWEGPDFDAAKNELGVEMIEIAHEGLTLGR